MIKSISHTKQFRVFLFLVGVVACSFQGLQAQGTNDSIAKIEVLLEGLDNKSNPKEVFPKILRLSRTMDTLFLDVINRSVEEARKHNWPRWQARMMLRKAALTSQQDDLEGIRFGMEVLEMHKTHKLPVSIVSLAHQIIAVGYSELGLFEEAIQERQLSNENIKGAKFSLRYYNGLNFIGRMYLKLLEFDSSITFFRKSYDYSILHGKRIKAGVALNDIGFVFFENREFDSAEVYFQKALMIFESGDAQTDEIMIGVLKGNLAKCMNIEGNYQTIIDLLNDNISVTKKYQDLSSLCDAYFDMGNLFFETGEFKKSLIYLDSSYTVNLKMDDEYDTYEKRISIHEAYVMLFEELRDNKRLVEYSAKLVALNNDLYGKKRTDELVRKLSEFKVAGIKNDLELKQALLKQKEEEIKFLAAEEKLANTRFVLFGLTALFVIIIGGFYFLKTKSDHRKEKEVQELNKRFLEASIASKTERLTQSALSISRKNDFTKSLLKKVGELEGVASKDISNLKLFISNESQLDENILEMEQQITELSKDFFVKLRTRYPELTENEVKLCGLIRLNMSNKEIAIIKNITPESVKIAKNRLSKKMELDPGSKVYDHLKMI